MNKKQKLLETHSNSSMTSWKEENEIFYKWNAFYPCRKGSSVSRIGRASVSKV